MSGIKIEALEGKVNYYTKLGFKKVGGLYISEGVNHMKMTLEF
jgi:predicted GNAT family N-acyltransferase